MSRTKPRTRLTSVSPPTRAADLRSDMNDPSGMSGRYCSGRGLRHQDSGEPVLDLPTAAFAYDLGAGEVGDIEHIDRPFAEGRDVGGGDIEIEAVERLGQFI